MLKLLESIALNFLKVFCWLFVLILFLLYAPTLIFWIWLFIPITIFLAKAILPSVEPVTLISEKEFDKIKTKDKIKCYNCDTCFIYNKARLKKEEYIDFFYGEKEEYFECNCPKCGLKYNVSKTYSYFNPIRF